MTNWAELKRLAESIKEGCGLQGADAEEAMFNFECAATPETILALIAENSAALNLLAVIHRDGGQHVDKFGFIQSCVLAEQKIFKERSDFDNWVYVSKTVDEGAKRLADYAVKLEQERDQLRAEVESLRNDADRMEFVAKNSGIYHFHEREGKWNCMDCSNGLTFVGKKFSSLREAIDAAIERGDHSE